MNVRIALLLLCPLLLSPGFARAAELLGGDTPVVPETAIIEDDLYVAGGTVRIAGSIRGDLVVAGGDVEIEGDVTGDLLVAGGTVRVSGNVAGTIRAAAGQFVLTRPVGEDLVVAAGRVEIGRSATIGRDLLASGGQVEIGGSVARRAQIGAGEARIDANIGDDVDAQVGSLQVGAVTIGGVLSFPENIEAQIDPGARIQGGIVHTEAVEQGRGWTFGGAVFLLLRLLVGLWALGALFVLAAPGWSARAAQVQLERPGAAALGGVAILLVLPMVAALVFGIGLLIGGWWIGLILFALYLIALCLAVPLAALAIGRAIASRFGKRPWAWPLLLLVGLLLLVIVFAIPIFGQLVGLIALLFGLGGLALGARGPRAAPAPPPG